MANETKKRRLIGADWVVRSRPALTSPDQQVFDELSVDDWFHMEYMDEGYYWARIGDVRVDIFISDGEPVRGDIGRGGHGKECGDTYHVNWAEELLGEAKGSGNE